MFVDMERSCTATIYVFPGTHCDGWQAKQIGKIIQPILAKLAPASESARSGGRRVLVDGPPLAAAALVGRGHEEAAETNKRGWVSPAKYRITEGGK